MNFRRNLYQTEHLSQSVLYPYLGLSRRSDMAQQNANAVESSNILLIVLVIAVFAIGLLQSGILFPSNSLDGSSANPGSSGSGIGDNTDAGLGATDDSNSPEQVVEQYWIAVDNGNVELIEQLVDDHGSSELQTIDEQALRRESQQTSISVDIQQVRETRAGGAAVVAVVTVTGDKGTVEKILRHDLRKDDGETWRFSQIAELSPPGQ